MSEEGSVMVRDWFKWSTAFLAGACLLLIGYVAGDSRSSARVLGAVEANKDALQQHVVSIHPLTEARLSEILSRMDKLERNQEKMLEVQQSVLQRLSKNGL